MAAVLAFFLLNSLLMAAVVTIDKRQGFIRTWLDCQSEIRGEF